MSCHVFYNHGLRTYGLTESPVIRNLNPMDLTLPSGYRIEVFVTGLNYPAGMVFSDNGELYIAESGLNAEDASIIRLSNGRFDIIARNFKVPVTGITYLDGNVYVSHKGYITMIRPNGVVQDIVAGLPCNGDNGISNLAFGPEGKIYFGLGTATNSGVVGADNQWLLNHPFLHDHPAIDITVIGQNYESDNIYVSTEEKAYTGAFAPYGETNMPNDRKRGSIRASGSVLRMNRDGTELELVAWGFRNPVHIRFDREFRLFVANRGYDVRGSRPIANALDEFHLIAPGVWYGWPDYSAGEPLTLDKFKPEGRLQPEFLLAEHPNIPPYPYAVFPPHSSITGFDFNYRTSFGFLGSVFIAEFGSLGPITMGESAPYAGISQRVSRIDMNTREVSTFISNKSGLPAYLSGEGGFGRPVDVKFGPDDAMYILDAGISERRNMFQIVPNTGVIWRVSRISFDI